ncbi:MAG: GNAT family N-acetyltransferase [Streptosporangiaceae bacterium]
MNVQLRPGKPSDASACGHICYEAFGAIACSHGFPNEFPSAEAAITLLSAQLTNPGFYSVVAETDGKIVGSNFLDERSPIVGVGPITVAPDAQNRGAGRLLMQDALQRATARQAPGIRGVQAAYHNRSLSLYAKLGFEVRAVLACMQGPPLHLAIPGYHVRPGTALDIAACDTLCVRIHGHHRHGEITDSVSQGGCLVVEHDGRITGYSAGLGFYTHSLGESTEDLKALIATAQAFTGPGILVPAANGALFRWCLNRGLRIVQTMTLMTIGLYNEPAGSYLPSILY